MNRSHLAVASILAASIVVAVEIGWIRKRYEPPSGTQPARASADAAIASHSLPEPPPYEPPATDASLVELAAWIRPRAGEEPWAEVNWLHTLEDAQSIAAQTNRPIFLWVTNQPMDRC